MKEQEVSLQRQDNEYHTRLNQPDKSAERSGLQDRQVEELR